MVATFHSHAELRTFLEELVDQRIAYLDAAGEAAQRVELTDQKLDEVITSLENGVRRKTLARQLGWDENTLSTRVNNRLEQRGLPRRRPGRPRRCR
jgi:hypothetical protein